MSLKTLALALAASTALAATPALAQDVNPAVVYDIGGRFDKSFNEGVYNGMERFKADTGTEYRDFEITNDSQREQALRRFAERGHSPILAVGFSHAQALTNVAAEFPDTQFAIIDSVVDLPNVQSITFKEHEGSYLVGMMAAMASETGTVGFVGGMDIPLIRAFACGYAQGAMAADGDVEVLQNMTGTTGAAFNDPVKGGELALGQIQRGADVVYHAAGGTGIGVLQAVADNDVLGIGVDSNQNGLQPGFVLTSMLKRVDNAAYGLFEDAMEGEFTPGASTLGLEEDGVGYAMDENNADLVSEEMVAAVEEAKAQIVAGEIEVHDYRTDSSCPTG